MELPKVIKNYMKLIIDNGYECYLVGGAVRDYLIGIENKDYDLCTNIPFDKLKELIPKLTIMKENEHRNTAIIRDKMYDIEFTMFRGNNLKEDLYNRDFTINSVAVDINGNLIDYYGGINCKIISLTQTDGLGLTNDPIRILRAIRFALKYNLDIDSNTKNKILSNKELLNSVAPQRVLEELKKILVLDNVIKYLDEYREVFFEIIPELKECNNFNQHNDYHIYDVYTHIINVVENSPKNFYLRLAALFHDIGKPRVLKIDDNNVGHFLGHANTSNNIFREFANKYKLDNKTKKIVSDLVLYHEDILSSKSNKIYNFYKKYNMNRIELLFDLKIADIKGQNPKYIDRINDIKELEKRYLDIRDSYNSIVYNGNNLISLGYNGKNISIILDDIKRRIINNQLDNDIEIINSYVLSKYSI
jgi:tRNA nucleotidyltransferase (CCA-adding enzyme)